MDYLIRISSNYEQVKNNLKSRGSVQLGNYKRDVQLLISDIVTLGRENQELFIRSLAMEGYLSFLSAKNLPVSLLEKRRILQVVFDKVKPHNLRPECLFIFLRIQNLLCYYLVQLEEVSVAKDILEDVEVLYHKLKNTEINKYLDPEDLFSEEPVEALKPVNSNKIEKIITNNIQMQAYVYNKLNMPEKYTVYNHAALKRQLVQKEGTPQDWVVRAARLGNYFTYLKELGNARYHLMAAYHVMKTCHENYKLMPSEFVVHKTEFEVIFLEISHYWVKYGLMLFKMSKQKVLDRYFKDSSVKDDPWAAVDVDMDATNLVEEEDNDNAEAEAKGDFSAEPIFVFPSLDLKELEATVPSQLATKSEEARTLFRFTHKWLMRAKNYYDFENHSAQYISCCLQTAELYENLAFFERTIDNQYSIQKLRADVLEKLNSLLKNCDNIMSVHIDVIRELSQVQLELMALNLQKLWREESHINVTNIDGDADSIINCLKCDSNKTLTEKNLNSTSKNLFLRKMEATTSINGKLFRLCSELIPPASSQSSLNPEDFY